MARSWRAQAGGGIAVVAGGAAGGIDERAQPQAALLTLHGVEHLHAQFADGVGRVGAPIVDRDFVAVAGQVVTEGAAGGRGGLPCVVDEQFIEFVFGQFAADVGPGDEVLMPGYLWVACLSAVVRAGGIPRLVEINDTFTMDPDDLERKISPRTKGRAAGSHERRVRRCRAHRGDLQEA